MNKTSGAQPPAASAGLQADEPSAKIVKRKQNAQERKQQKKEERGDRESDLYEAEVLKRRAGPKEAGAGQRHAGRPCLGKLRTPHLTFMKALSKDPKARGKTQL
jgi:hypothetical protein